MTGRPLTLGRITEGLAHWADDDMDPDLAPGLKFTSDEARYATSLGKALGWTASSVGAGVIGGYAYDLIKMMMHQS